ncbi:helix-turn-helix domain-containing protein [Flavobacterium psychrotrophum]|uniref:helix-turn-helix domain-containing protein n=1 Tax=Flavobacterium psychrotrophum TaxID=2294119 RepID=UPI000E30B845|nr:helix-turn-helix domain-containing protein [Flavobacterium psychrotrophum]
MKKEEIDVHKFGSISEAHEIMGLPKPKHPLISLINGSDIEGEVRMPTGTHILQFYKMSYKPKLGGKLKYGQGYYDFDEGGLLFASPNQVIGQNENESVADCSQYTLLIHPDFLWNYPLAKKIKQYGFFSYATDETLHLSETEKDTIMSIFKMIEAELNSRIDDFSQDVMIAHIELLLSYANRFYKRQFITRKAVNHEVLQKLDDLLENYLSNEATVNQGLPTVHYLAEKLNLTPSYLSDMLRSLIGQNAQQYIHAKLIDKAKELLSSTTLSMSQIAYQLGFEHSQSFSRLFKTKTSLSPLEFRQSFN